MISILCPTRKRPQGIKRVVNSICETIEDISQVELLIYIDDDDDESIPAIQEIAEKIPTNAVQGNKLIGSQMYNELGKMATGDIIMFAADDIVFQTKNWDKIVRAEFDACEDKILFVYGEDGYQHGRIGTHGFIHRFWMELVGYVLPPKLASAYTDEWITELSERIGRKRYLPELYIEHLHRATGKSPDDDTYRQRLEVAGDIASYYKGLEPDRVKDATKLAEYIKLFQ